MKRRLVTIAAPVSLLLCIATAWLWARTSHDSGELIFVRMRSDGTIGNYGIISNGGRLLLMSLVDEGMPVGHPDSHWVVRFETGDQSVVDVADGPTVRDAVHDFGHEFHGFGFVDEHTAAERFATVMAPHWFALLLFASGPTFVAVARWSRAARRQRRGLCVRCGYDLRASHERCPECGAAIKSFAV